jgi:hypothetical protein
MANDYPIPELQDIYPTYPPPRAVVALVRRAITPEIVEAMRVKGQDSPELMADICAVMVMGATILGADDQLLQAWRPSVDAYLQGSIGMPALISAAERLLDGHQECAAASRH